MVPIWMEIILYWPGSWILKHFLIQFMHVIFLLRLNDPKTNQPKMDDSTAKNKIDSLKTLIDKGQHFDSVAFHFSDDEGSRIKGGDLGYFGQGQMVKEFG